MPPYPSKGLSCRASRSNGAAAPSKTDPDASRPAFRKSRRVTPSSMGVRGRIAYSPVPMTPIEYSDSRRRFLTFLAASPALAYAELPGALAAALQTEPMLRSPKDALNVMEFEAIARKTLPPAHFAYLMTGVDDDATIRANREGYGRVQLRVRRLVDIRIPDTAVTLLGKSWLTPIVICPVGSQKAFHADGEMATARAAKGHLQVLSTVATTSVEDVNAARPGE